jgi:16S rRNA (guanine966-N2)-methyltransferase
MLRFPSRPATRPTSTRLREAIFSSLGDTSHDRVADLFAGSGILGIEALSRGANFATFVESDRSTASIIRANLEKSGFVACSQIVVRSVESFLRAGESVFDLVLADPPYEYADLDGLVASASKKLLPEGGVLVLEHASRRPAPAASEGSAIPKTRIHGDSAFTVYVKK